MSNPDDAADDVFALAGGGEVARDADSALSVKPISLQPAFAGSPATGRPADVCQQQSTDFAALSAADQMTCIGRSRSVG